MLFTSVSLVIPTYNRGKEILDTINRILESNLTSINFLEVIVVDDGSTEPIESFLSLGEVSQSNISLRCIRQENSGVGAARNRGFREATGDIILFIDDDILVSPELIRQHVEAHREHPNSVICGFAPFVSCDTPSLTRFADKITNYVFSEDLRKEFVKGEIVISGQLSIERQMFGQQDYFYRDDLTTPAAEEIELSYRLYQQKISILHAKHIVAIHNHHLTYSWLCSQQYKYGIGLGEVYTKYPQIIEFSRVAGVLTRFGQPQVKDAPVVYLKKTVKNILILKRMRTLLLNAINRLEKIAPNSTKIMSLYELGTSTHYWAGLKQGLRQFK
jgi:glycosyltransferase involved in cell wall biosynthesis